MRMRLGLVMSGLAVAVFTNQQAKAEESASSPFKVGHCYTLFVSTDLHWVPSGPEESIKVFEIAGPWIKVKRLSLTDKGFYDKGAPL